MSSDYKAVVHERDKVCVYCGTSSRLTVHHVQPKCQGGANTPQNCILLCQSCHRALHSQQGYPVRTKNKKNRRKKRRR